MMILPSAELHRESEAQNRVGEGKRERGGGCEACVREGRRGGKCESVRCV